MDEEQNSDTGVNMEVVFYDAQKRPVGKMMSERDGRWQRIPIPIALKMFEFRPPEFTPEMVQTNQIIGLFRTNRGLAEMWGGSAPDAWTKMAETVTEEDAMNARFTVEVDARILHADGTWC